MAKFLTSTPLKTILLSEHFLRRHRGLKGDGRIAGLELGRCWPPNGRQFGKLLDLPRGGIYPCQQSPATRAVAYPQCLRQWKHGRSLMEGIYCLDDFGFLISLYSQYFILSYWFSPQCICLALKNWAYLSPKPVFPTGQVGQAVAKLGLAYGNSLGPGLARTCRLCKA